MTSWSPDVAEEKNTSLLLHTLEAAVNVKQLCQKSTPSDALDLSSLLQYPLPHPLAACGYIKLNLKQLPQSH